MYSLAILIYEVNVVFGFQSLLQHNTDIFLRRVLSDMKTYRNIKSVDEDKCVTKYWTLQYCNDHTSVTLKSGREMKSKQK